MREGVGNVIAGLDGVVAVDDRKVDRGKGLGDADDVGVLLNGERIGGLVREGVGNVIAGLDGVVAVDDRKVDRGKGTRQRGGLELLELEVVRVLLDVLGRGLKVLGVGKGDQAKILQQEQGATLVGGAGSP